jgi:biofilm PGA synthesis N-glycosyltransferase PgaC
MWQDEDRKNRSSLPKGHSQLLEGSLMSQLEVYRPLPQNKLVAKAVVRGRQLLGVREAPLVVEAPRTATISAIIPAHNEEETIEAVIKAILHSTRIPDECIVVINGCDDDTLEIAQRYTGYHERVVKGVKMSCFVRVVDMGENPDGKVGALNYGFRMAKHADFILGVDGDTIVDRRCIEQLELEMVSDSRIGGISAIYTIGYEQGNSPFARFLIAGQRAQFSGFHLDNLLNRGRHVAVLGGQTSLFRTEALEAVMEKYRQTTCWTSDSQVEDSLLSIQIKSCGYFTKISAEARAEVGGMVTTKALHNQRLKWNAGALELIKQFPFHPSLRIRWRENVNMFMNCFTRLAFISLLIAALSIHVFTFNPMWLIPPFVAIGLNLKTAMHMKDKNWRDIAFAALAIPAEVYTWLMISHAGAAWYQVLSKQERDNWAAQHNAERGKASMSWLYPLFVGALFVAGAVFMWSQQDRTNQMAILWWGWLTLYLITIGQTLTMLKKTLRRTRGFKT